MQTHSNKSWSVLLLAPSLWPFLEDLFFLGQGCWCQREFVFPAELQSPHLPAALWLTFWMLHCSHLKKLVLSGLHWFETSSLRVLYWWLFWIKAPLTLDHLSTLSISDMIQNINNKVSQWLRLTTQKTFIDTTVFAVKPSHHGLRGAWTARLKKKQIYWTEPTWLQTSVFQPVSNRKSRFCLLCEVVVTSYYLSLCFWLHRGIEVVPAMFLFWCSSVCQKYLRWIRPHTLTIQKDWENKGHIWTVGLCGIKVKRNESFDTYSDHWLNKRTGLIDPSHLAF